MIGYIIQSATYAMYGIVGTYVVTKAILNRAEVKQTHDA